MGRLSCLGLGVVCVALASVVTAAPRIPHDINEVLAVLPTKLTQQQVMPKTALTQEQTISQVQQFLKLATENADPRYLGYAQALLQPWSTTQQRDILLLRARIAQMNHDFDAALKDLDIVVAQSPNHAEALLLKTSIYLVKGEINLAQQSCQPLKQLATLTLGLICEAQIQALGKNAEQAYQQMLKLSTLVASLDDEQQEWFYLAFGDLAMRLGNYQQAESLYKKIPQRQPVVLAAIADLWLLQKRYADVKTLLIGHQQQDALLLRLAIAEKKMATKQANVYQQILVNRFAALRQRGDDSHLREEAIFALKVQDQLAASLLLARKNWQQQREPADAVIYWQAASAQQSATDLKLLTQWYQTTGLKDKTPMMAQGVSP